MKIEKAFIVIGLIGLLLCVGILIRDRGISQKCIHPPEPFTALDGHSLWVDKNCLKKV